MEQALEQLRQIRLEVQRLREVVEGMSRRLDAQAPPPARDDYDFDMIRTF